MSVLPPPKAEPPLRVLALVTDGFGGHGGIAPYNYGFLRTLTGLDRVADVVVIPRFGELADEARPRRWLRPPAGKAGYVGRVLALTFDPTRSV